MRNILNVDLTNTNCNGVCSSDCGSNCSEIVINVSGFELTNPYLYFVLQDGSIYQTEVLEISNGEIYFIVPENIINANGTVKVQVKANNYESETIYIDTVSYTVINSLVCKYSEGRFVYNIIGQAESLIEVLSTAIPVTEGVTTEVELLNTTIERSGTYLFTANIPVNYYGQEGRELRVRLRVNGITKWFSIGVINTYAWTLYVALSTVLKISANDKITITIQDAAGKKYTCGQFGFRYIPIETKVVYEYSNTNVLDLLRKQSNNPIGELTLWEGNKLIQNDGSTYHWVGTFYNIQTSLQLKFPLKDGYKRKYKLALEYTDNNTEGNIFVVFKDYQGENRQVSLFSFTWGNVEDNIRRIDIIDAPDWSVYNNHIQIECTPTHKTGDKVRIYRLYVLAYDELEV